MEKKKKKKKKMPPPSAYANVYYDPSHPAGFGSIDSLRRAVPGATVESTREWLRGEEAYTLHKPARRRFKRDRIVVEGIDDQWAADLLDVQAIADRNDGYKYLLTIVDTLSKKAWVRPLKVKTAAAVAEAFKDVFETDGRVPRKLRTDKGLEFRGRAVQDLLRQRKVHYFTSNNETKEAVVERFNRTLRSRLWRYFGATNDFRYVEALPQLVKAYNEKKHRSIGVAPNDVTPYNAHEIRKRLYGSWLRHDKRPSRLAVGDLVRLNKAKDRFEQGYKSSWTDEIFVIHAIVRTGVYPRYRVRDADGEVILGTFQEAELQKVRRVPKVVSSRRKSPKDGRVYVTWRGYPQKLKVAIQE